MGFNLRKLELSIIRIHAFYLLPCWSTQNLETMTVLSEKQQNHMKPQKQKLIKLPTRPSGNSEHLPLPPFLLINVPEIEKKDFRAA